MLTQADIQNTIAFLGEVTAKGDIAELLVDLKRKYKSLLQAPEGVEVAEAPKTEEGGDAG